MNDDTISRAAAVKALEETKQSDPFNRYEYQNIGIDWSIDAIKALPSAQPGWIPTSERLPDNDRAVLVTLKWAEDDYEVAVGEYWHNSTASHGWGSFEGHVIAWHELPTPYREGGQDGKN